jgi:hypothetical protein
MFERAREFHIQILLEQTNEAGPYKAAKPSANFECDYIETPT